MPQEVPQDESKKPRIGNAHACVRCRQHKVRCEVGETRGSCFRCERAKATCEQHVPRRRQPKKKAIRSKTSEADQVEDSQPEDPTSVRVAAGIASPTSPPPLTGPPQLALPPVSSTATFVAQLTLPLVQGSANSAAQHLPPPGASFVKSPSQCTDAPIQATNTAASPSQYRLPPIATITCSLVENVQLPAVLSPPPAPARPPAPSATTTLPGVSSSFPAISLSQTGELSDFSRNLASTLVPLYGLNRVIQDISYAQINHCVEVYRTSLVDSFPFVPLPADESCSHVLHRRPLLALAILVVSNHDHPPIQQSLSQDFRKVVMAKIINGVRSLDLVQALLVFIAWHHQYMDSNTTPVGLLLHFCITLAGELGLDDIPPGPQSEAEHRSSREAKRAFLGCYYVSGSLPIHNLSKSRPMTYSESIRMYTSELHARREFETDAMLPTLMETCRFLEDVEETFPNKPQLTCIAMAQAQRLIDAYSSIQRDLLSNRVHSGEPTKFAQNTQLLNGRADMTNWTQLKAKVCLYKSIAFSPTLDAENISGDRGFLLSMRVSCLRAIDDFLKHCTQLSMTQWKSLSIVDWISLISSFTALRALSMHLTPLPGSHFQEFHPSRMFGAYREELCAKMPQLINNARSGDDCFARFRRGTGVMEASFPDFVRRVDSKGSSFGIMSQTSHLDTTRLQNGPMGKGEIDYGQPSPPSKRDSVDEMTSNEFLWKFLRGEV
ncbi:uncharacterized protein EI97DRAFT_71001 [Westerdykella ornata]|uniref:Zn(2)-C6 fungal-type domain-containing protein n=1 Tax=Westerdykella ornata TaxID=318751 RepID=A0A6A6JH97_WESOR|nr:uncharacterized protein EI97DRAFT_71001 [Westerdykella ornata]KAF2275747.1 hypothetical protein EI97DRAFT_71001 [Westerdykella ornata]